MSVRRGLHCNEPSVVIVTPVGAWSNRKTSVCRGRSLSVAVIDCCSVLDSTTLRGGKASNTGGLLRMEAGTTVTSPSW